MNRSRILRCTRVQPHASISRGSGWTLQSSMHFTRKSALPVQWLALLTTLATALAQPASPQSSEPLLQPANLVYQGAFRVPEGSTNQTSFSYGGTALTYNPINNSLYLTGHDWYQLSAEIS